MKTGEAASTRPWVVLVEDNPMDARLLQSALLAEDSAVEIQVFEHGDQAAEFFEEEYPERSPNLIVLDFNLPGRDGGMLAGIIRQTKWLKDAPIVMLSSAPAAYVKARAAGADAFWTKPSDLEGLEALGKRLIEFLGKRNTLSARSSLI